jgi:hypothetical protein
MSFVTYKRFVMSVFAAAALWAQQTTFPPAPAEAHSERFGARIQRTMKLLATSTPAHRNPVRILFYGQSITKQEWSRDVAEDLRRRFPSADLTIENRAIGGYSTEYLIQTVAHDVYGFYPDLVIFHVFGGHENYEKIIAGIRAHTTAEILIQSDYPVWTHVDGEEDPPAKVRREQNEDRHSYEWLPSLCEKVGCEVVDVRRPWYEYLAANKLSASALLADGVHLNEHGNYLLAALTKPHLRYDPAFPVQAAQTVKSYPLNKDMSWKDGRLVFEFEGNRVDVIAAAGPTFHGELAGVRIDGQRPSDIPGLYSITRPTDTFAVDWPALNRVTAEKPLLVEDWTLRVTETAPDDSWWRFEVSGSKTGPDGTGRSDERFVSKSGRVVTEPNEWGVKRAWDLRHQRTPTGFEVRWQVVPMFCDVYRTPRVADRSREYVTTLAQGLENGRHTLELVTRDKTNPPIAEFRVYTPPVR